MKTPQEYEQEIADLKNLIDKLKIELTKALQACVDLSKEAKSET